MTRMFRFVALALPCAVVACDENAEPTNATVTQAPATYSIYPADLYREVPSDICRSTDPEFLQALISRVRKGVAPDRLVTFKFEDFSVTDGFEGKNREAILRFRVGARDEAPVLMYAVGAFNPKGCRVAELRVGEGAGPYETSNPREIRVQ
ncbi:hypothetical protein [Sphingomonas sp.]|jgi:hypothetical protein|uniref:hypothetical protein n=1 Tax=Sphingomonas sp. TaxID=28214 RepID=UPI002E14F5E8|nr:hypothetical protein [Sphingomonas sp.]